MDIFRAMILWGKTAFLGIGLHFITKPEASCCERNSRVTCLIWGRNLSFLVDLQTWRRCIFNDGIPVF